MSAAPARTAGPVSAEEWAEHREAARQELPAALTADNDNLPALLLPYQGRLLETTALSQLTVCEKSRRIGMTWAVAADAVLHAGRRRSHGGMDVLYIGYNLDMAREFIDVCAMWARAYAEAAYSSVEEFLFAERDEAGIERSIKAFRITFASGFEIVALTSKPRSLRGRQGYVIFDEAAFHDALEEMLKAAIALFVWGGKLLVISTHDGEDNAFNQLIKEIRAGKRKGEVLRVDFQEALADGLYERICLVTGETYSAEAERRWAEDLYGFYGRAAEEELDCIPSEGSGRALTLTQIEAAQRAGYRVLRWAPPDAPDKDFVDWPEALRLAEMESWLESEVRPILAELPQRRTAIGGDFAMRQDRSCYAVGYTADNLTRQVPLVVELARCPYQQQRQVLFYIVDRLRGFSGGILDANGNGMPLAQEARQRYGAERIVELLATDPWYRENWPPFEAAFQDRTLQIPADAELRDDLRLFANVRGVVKIPRDVRTEAGDGGKRHGDGGVALLNFYTASRSDFPEIAFTATGETRAGYQGFVETADARPEQFSDRGFGAVRGQNDFTGY